MLHLPLTWNPARALFMRTTQVLTLAVASLMASATLAAPAPADDTPSASQASAEQRLRPQIESPLRVRSSSVGSSSFRDESERSIGHRELQVAGALPLLSTPGLSLGLTAAYSLRWAHVEGLEQWAPDDSIRLHRIEIAPLVLVALSSSHRLLVRPGLVVASDFEKVGREALQPSLQLLDSITVSDSVALLAGAGLSRQFFALVPYPMLGVVYAPSGSPFRVDVLLPKTARARVTVAKGLSFVAHVDYQVRVWQRGEHGDASEYAVKSGAARAGLTARVALDGPLMLELTSGVVAFQRMTVGNGDEAASADLQPGSFFFEVNLAALTF